MSSRQAILDRLRSRIVPDTELPPELGFEPLHYQDLLTHFCESVQGVGGSVMRANSEAEAVPMIAGTETCRSAERVLAFAFAQELSTIDPMPTEASQVVDVDLVIAPGLLGVAENGAVWITDLQVQPRAALFLTQHLMLTVPSTAIVATMHQAYQRVESGSEDYGVFISGPSKTADIEQSLVLGAHGPRTLTVVLC